MRRILKIAALAAAIVFSSQARAEPSTLIIHEWGTFTSFQDEHGTTISGINVDDEPVPKFVHRLDALPIFTTHGTPAMWSQGAPRCHEGVTLRLETPVVYFYPQEGFDAGQPLDVQATFVGGWLTEFYPAAATDNPGFPKTLDSKTEGRLRWTGLRIARDAETHMPPTTDHVWLAPRQVRSAIIANADKNEAEKYLFYRGVGNLDAPLVLRSEAGAVAMTLRKDGSLDHLPPMWLVHVFPDGKLAYRRVQSSGERTATVALPLASEASRSELDALRAELRSTLLAEGLYEDEADAMLATWRLSYFDSEGLRVFFLLPRPWIEARLPLSTSIAADITRVMLGRVELVSPYQRTVLQRLYGLPESAFGIKPLYYESEEALKLLYAGNTSHADLYRKTGREVPEALQLYDSLGRFRDALLIREIHSTADTARRDRIRKIIAAFSACLPDDIWSE